MNSALPVDAFSCLCSYAEAKSVMQINEGEGYGSLASYIAFISGGRNYLLSVRDLAEVTHNIQEITRIPFSPPWLVGLAAARGQVYSVIDFARLMNMSSKKKGVADSSYLLLSGLGDGFMLKVDEVVGIRRADLSGLINQERYITTKVELDKVVWQLINIDRLIADDFLFNFQD